MTTARAARIHAFGDADQIVIDTIELPEPGPGEVGLRQTAIGFNYIDVYQRKGVYPLPLPTGLGHEAVGVVERVGPGVEVIEVGDRVAYINAGVGAYADRRNVLADRVVVLPDDLSDEAAATLLFKGLTAHYLVRKTYRVEAGDLILVHAAAGGVGQILCRWAKDLGAEVAGTAGGPEKVAIAREAGCDIAIDYRAGDWTQAFLEATGGRKARVVYDSVGKDTFLGSLDCTAPFGLAVSFGGASGPAPEISMDLLNKKGCLYVTRPSLFPHIADPQVFAANAAELFDAIARGVVTVPIGARFTLDQIADVHRAAESRSTTGAILITP